MPVVTKRTEVLVGLFLLIGLVLLGGLILQFGRFKEKLKGQYSLTIVFDDASGVIKGSDVRMGGARIGDVSELPMLNSSVKVEVPLLIQDDIKIPLGSTFQINSATLLGDKLIVIIPPKERTDQFIVAGSRIEGDGMSGLEAIQNNVEQVTKDVVRIVKDAEETMVKVDQAAGDIKSASAELNQAMIKVNQTLLTEKNLARVDSTLENLSTTTEEWKAITAKLNPTLEEARVAIDAIRQAAEGAEKTLNTADQAIVELKPALKKIPKAVDEFSDTSRKAGDALDRMKNGEGLLGALASDNDVALDAKAFMKNLREYGIFRYKDGVSKERAQGKTSGQRGDKPKAKLRGRPTG